MQITSARRLVISIPRSQPLGNVKRKEGKRSEESLLGSPWLSPASTERKPSGLGGLCGGWGGVGRGGEWGGHGGWGD